MLLTNQLYSRDVSISELLAFSISLIAFFSSLVASALHLALIAYLFPSTLSIASPSIAACSLLRKSVIKKGLFAIINNPLPFTKAFESVRLALTAGFVSENFDIDSDGILSVEELKAVTEIKMKWMVADSVKGIEYFTELTVFKSEINTLTELDLSANTKLETVVCTLGSLKSVNFKNLKNLIDLNCSYNSLEELDLSDCVELKFLQAANNNIRTIDLRSCTKLESIQLCGNELTAIDISNCPNLDFLDCESNRINSLNLTGADFLEYLYLSDNRIGVLDVSSCKKLSTLTLNNNGLKSLNVKGCDRLSELYLFNNLLKSIDLSSNKELRQLNVAMNSLVALDVKANTNLPDLE